jgi:hypothetical protein
VVDIENCSQVVVFQQCLGIRPNVFAGSSDLDITELRHATSKLYINTSNSKEPLACWTIENILDPLTIYFPQNVNSYSDIDAKFSSVSLACTLPSFRLGALLPVLLCAQSFILIV